MGSDDDCGFPQGQRLANPSCQAIQEKIVTGVNLNHMPRMPLFASVCLGVGRDCAGGNRVRIHQEGPLREAWVLAPVSPEEPSAGSSGWWRRRPTIGSQHASSNNALSIPPREYRVSCTLHEICTCPAHQSTASNDLLERPSLNAGDRMQRAK